MDKKRFSRFSRLFACLTVCTFLLGGCSFSGQAAASAAPGGAVQADMGAGTALDDGALRVLDGGGNSTATVFCGAKVLYTAPSHGSAYLLTDECTGTAQAYVTAAPEGSDAYVRNVYDNTGAKLYSCAADEYPLSLCNGWLLSGISHPETSPSFTDCRLVQLSTGKTQAVPDGANQLFALSPELACLSGCVWDASGDCTGSFCTFYNAEMEPLKSLDGCTATRPYWSGGDFAANWVDLSGQSDTGEYTSSYYNPVTGITLENVAGACGAHYVSQRAEDGSCPVWDVDTNEVVAALPYPCDVYFAASGSAIYYDSDSENYQAYLCRADGSTEAVSNYDVQESDGTCTVLYPERLEVYDASGALLYTQPLAAVPAEQTRYSSALSGGRCLIIESDLMDTSSSPRAGNQHITLYDASGDIWESSDYFSIYQGYRQDYLFADRYTAGLSSVTDLLDCSGAPLVTGLKSAYGTFTGDVVPACRGFFEGWMDTQGNWLWKRSIWQTAADEVTLSFYGE